MRILSCPQSEDGYCEMAITPEESLVLIRLARYTVKHLEWEYHTRTGYDNWEVPLLVKALKNNLDAPTTASDQADWKVRLSIVNYWVLRQTAAEVCGGMRLPKKYKFPQMYCEWLLCYMDLYRPPGDKETYTEIMRVPYQGTEYCACSFSRETMRFVVALAETYKSEEGTGVGSTDATLFDRFVNNARETLRRIEDQKPAIWMEPVLGDELNDDTTRELKTIHGEKVIVPSYDNWQEMLEDYDWFIDAEELRLLKAMLTQFLAKHRSNKPPGYEQLFVKQFQIYLNEV